MTKYIESVTLERNKRICFLGTYIEDGEYILHQKFGNEDALAVSDSQWYWSINNDYNNMYNEMIVMGWYEISSDKRIPESITIKGGVVTEFKADLMERLC